MKWPNQGIQSSMDSPLGKVRLLATSKGLAGIWFHDQKHLPEDEHFARWSMADGKHNPILVEAQSWLEAYFLGDTSAFCQPLDLSAGTVFQQAVWTALLTVPSGHTLSYGQLAHQIDRPAAVRAVGAAVGRNPMSILIPCHRVVGANGALTGYAGGLERKTTLLRLENTNT